MNYRADIDGLRALAVLPVVFFHAGFSYFVNGFLGVDIFFVISGFLITTIILGDIEHNKFKIIHFYERRARRILPALFFICLISIPLAWSSLLPSDLNHFGKSLISSISFTSNIFFWQSINYFDVESDLKPLLHTWSLAIEEQFYILYPLFLLIFWKFGIKKILFVLMLFFLISLAISTWAALHKPVANFYLLPTRGWEIIAGAISAFYIKYYSTTFESIFLKNILSFFGLILIFLSLTFFTPDTPTPSYKTLSLIIGTVFILIFYDERSLISRILSVWPLTFLGLLSYSWYLWHFPLLAFARNYSLREISDVLIILIIFLSLFLSYLSWRFIENPFRNSNKLSRKKIIYVLLITLFVILTSAFHIIFKGKSHERVPYNFFEPNYGMQSKDCINKSIEECILNTKSKFLLWGDSYAMHLAQALTFSESKIIFSQATKNTCSPIINISKNIRNINFADECISFNKKVVESAIKNENIEYIIMSSTFELINNYPIKQNLLSVTKNKEDVILENLILTIDMLKNSGKKIVIVSPTPSTGLNYDPGRCTIKAIYRSKDPKICFFNKEEFSEKTINGLKILKKIENEANILWIDQLLCSEGVCKTILDNQPIYRDNGHLSTYGSKYIGEKFNFNKLLLNIFEKTE